MTNSSPATASSAAAGSVVASGGISNPPPGPDVGTSGAARCASRVHASSASSTVDAAQSERRNIRRESPSRDAFARVVSRARRRASRTTGVGGTGSYSPFEHGPSGIGSSGSLIRDRSSGIAHGSSVWQTPGPAPWFRPTPRPA